ncbi:hypothetical protein [Kouleothrix sp.]|uniref:hypothetical protein n=1 Tax=Kouleothrix sp. TaxID=2779161 RepID=UPI00391A6A3F
MNRWFDTIGPTMALLDEGLSLYRRNFTGFLLITACWCIPAAITTGLLIVAASWLEGPWPALLLLAALLLLFPLLIYLIGGLSRAAATAASGQPVRLRAALAIAPRRAAGMGCFTIVFAMLAQIITSMLSVICICPMYVAGFALIGALVAGSRAGAVPAGIAIVGIALFGFYGSLMLSGASGGGLFYGLQPWVQEQLPFGASLQRSIDLIVYRLGRNLLAWLIGALLLAAAGLTVSATIGVLLPLPLIYALGDSPATQAIAAVAWALGLMVILPPLPIWMALLYRHNRAAFDGDDLQAKVNEWCKAEASV